MIEVTITMRGELDDIRGMLVKVLGDAVEVAPQPINEKEETATPSEWSREEIVKFWSEVHSIDARRILAEIAKSPAPTGYPVGDVAKVLGFEKNQWGGKLSSVGFALKRTFPGRNILNVDWPLYRYMLTPEVASTIRELAEAEGL